METNTRNYCSNKGITYFTGHQLNKNASMIKSGANGNYIYPIKAFHEGCLADCIDVARETDTLIFLDLQYNHVNIPFLLLRRYKRRGDEEVVKDSDKFIAYRLYDYGLKEDIDDRFSGVKDIFSITDEDDNSQHNTKNKNQDIF